MHWFLFAVGFLFGDMQIQLGKQILTVEIADTEESRSKGLMGRKNLEEGRGMLFVYKEPEILNFWMKNTLIPLSIGFFDEKKTLIGTADMNPPRGNSFPTTQSPKPSLYALEVPQGWFSRNKIHSGAKFSFLDPSNAVK